MRELKYFWLSKIIPLLKSLGFYWLVGLASFASLMGWKWKKISWLVPVFLREREAEQCWVQDGLVYSIFLTGLPGDEYYRLPKSAQKLLQAAWYCGYVRYPNCPFLIPSPTKPTGMSLVDYMMLMGKSIESRFATCIPVHGGITYEKTDTAGYVVGFDCNHLGDENNPVVSDPNWVAGQCHQLRKAIDICMKGGFEQRYITTRDPVERAQITDEFQQALAKNGIGFPDNNYMFLLGQLGGKF